MLNQDIIREATRLTRAGQLVEATALLQRMLRGENVPDTPSRTVGLTALREPLIIDAKANAVEEADTHPQLRPAISAQPRTLRALLDRKERRSGIGLRGVMKRAPVSTPDIVPDGAHFIEGAYSSPAGSRAYRLFIPSRYQDRPIPLVVMLHGCTQSPDDFAAGTRMNFIAEEQNCFAVYPAQPSQANQAKCWNWFRTADQQRGTGEPSLIAGITRQIMDKYSVDPKRVYVGGLSAGAAAAAVMGATYNDLYAAIGIHSGLACGIATDLPSALVAMRQGGSGHKVVSGDQAPVPTIVFHGDRDATVHPKNGEPNSRAVRENDADTEGGASRASIRRACLYPNDLERREWTRYVGALECPRSRTRMVRRQPCGLLHRSARTGCHKGNASLFPRAFAARGVRSPQAGEPISRCGAEMSAYDQIEGKLALNFRSLGPQTLKNIIRPVEAFVVELHEWEAAAIDPALLKQETSYCRTPDHVRLAWAKVGRGPPLMRAGSWLTHIEYDWANPVRRAMLQKVARRHTLIRYDARGNGLSDWDVPEISLEAWISDLETVVDAAGLTTFPLLGISQGCAVSIAYAVRHPERVSQLVLYGGFALRRNSHIEQLCNGLRSARCHPFAYAMFWNKSAGGRARPGSNSSRMPRARTAGNLVS